MTWPDSFLDNIIQGDCLDVMKQMPDDCVQTCITSPPYWGLRDYSIESVIWDGEDGCEHEWGNMLPANPAKYREGLRFGKWETGGQPTATYSKTQGAFCQHCSAWRGSLGLEPTPELYISHLAQIFEEVKRVLREDGTLWLNIGDSYAGNATGSTGNHSTLEGGKRTQWEAGRRPNKISDGLKPKDMCLMPFRLAIALQEAGWWVRSDIIWHKPNCMPSSVRDRPTTDFEHVFLLAKSKRYYYDQDAIREPLKAESEARYGYTFGGKKNIHIKETQNPTYLVGNRTVTKRRNKRTVWSIPTQSFPGAHFATFPPALIRPMVLAGSSESSIVLDPFAGSGTTCVVAKEMGRHWIGIEANPEYVAMAEKRVSEAVYQPALFST